VTSSLEGGGVLLSHPLPTAGIVYLDVALDLQRLPLSELPLLPLFTRLLTGVGTSDLDPATLQRRIGARTGGISATCFTQQPISSTGAIADPLAIVHKLVVRGKATVDRVEDVLDLMYMILSDNQLDSQAKVVEMLRETKSELESSFVSSGNSFAGSRLSARQSLLGYISEISSGVSYYESVKEMLTAAQEDWPSLLGRLKKLRATILAQQDLVISLTVDPAGMDASTSAIDAFVRKLPPHPIDGHVDAKPWADEVELLPLVDESFAIVTQVNYVAAGCRLVQPGELCNAGAFSVVSQYLSQGYLWDNVRVVGGAYGGGCGFNPNNGAFVFSSYRDPNFQSTLDIYSKTCQVLKEAEISDEALEQAIVGTVGSLDSPMTSDQKGFRSLGWYLIGQTTELRQRYRDQMLNTSRKNFMEFAEQLEAASLKVAAFASKEAIENANAARSAGDQLQMTDLA